MPPLRFFGNTKLINAGWERKEMKILEIEMFSDRLDETEAFYKDIVGLVLEDKSEEHLQFKAGFSSLRFKRSSSLNAVYHFAFNVPYNMLEEAYFWISSKWNLLPVQGDEKIADFEAWNARAFYFYDNNGNIVEFIARKDLEALTEKPFTSGAVISLGEIGIVTDDVKKFTRRLTKLTGVEIFARQEPHSNFAALGNDEGLFIISETGRHWFPTERESQKFPCRVRFETGQVLREITFNSEEIKRDRAD